MINSPLTFSSDDPLLACGFEWAKAQALAYVFSGDPVGDWYEAALPGRAAFCMRDVSHQATGAHVLGLAAWNYNMLRCFAGSISAERDWCSLWEIDKLNRPCPADYRDDRYFWYNFPANFDVLDCCFRQYLWTANPLYLEDRAFRFFYAKSVNEYVQRWDLDHDGLMEHYPKYGFRGIATYNEEVQDPLIGADLIAAQYAAYLRYASILELEGRAGDASAYREKAVGLKTHFRERWWDAEQKQFFGFVTQAHTFVHEPGDLTGLLPLYFHLVDNPEQVNATLDDLIRAEAGSSVEGRSYIPEVLYQYGRQEAAYRTLSALFDPALPRREYPELSFAMIGALCTGLMGIRPDARERVVRTLPRLTPAAGWAEIDCLPVFDGQLSVHHLGEVETNLMVHSGRPVFWKAAFPGRHEIIEVDGKAYPASHATTPAGEESFVLIRAAAGETHITKAI